MNRVIGWHEQWNKIIRKRIFPDHDLKSLMKIPPKTGIIQFIDNFFIRAGYTNKILTNETCRIVYSDNQPSDVGHPNVTRNTMFFDIYVKIEDLHNVGDDRLMYRTYLIGERLSELLTDERYCEETGYRFWPAGDWDLGTRTIGYARYCIAFNYMKVY